MSGYTPNGYYVHTKTPAALCDRLYELEDDCGLSHIVLNYLRDTALGAGLDVIACPKPLAPDKLEHLFIPSEQLGFVSGSFGEPYRRVRLSAYVDPEHRASVKGHVRLLRKMSAELIDDATLYFSEIKRRHDELEKIFNPHVDFDSLYAYADEIAASFAKRFSELHPQ